MENKREFYISDNTIFALAVVAVIGILYCQKLNYQSAQKELENYTNSTICPEIDNASTAMYEKRCRQILLVQIVESKVVSQNINPKIKLTYLLDLQLPSSQVENVKLLAFVELEARNPPFVDTFETPYVFYRLHTGDVLEVESWNDKITLVYSTAPLGNKIAIPTTDYPEYIANNTKDDFYVVVLVGALVIAGTWLYLKIFVKMRRNKRRKAKLWLDKPKSDIHPE